MKLPNLENASIKRVFFKPYNYVIEYSGQTYYVKQIKVHNNSILSINSKITWQIKYGKSDGVRFKTSSTELVDMSSFQKLQNKIVVFKDVPHKILKYINESDVIDISNEKEIHDIKIFPSLRSLCLKET